MPVSIPPRIERVGIPLTSGQQLVAIVAFGVDHKTQEAFDIRVLDRSPAVQSGLISRDNLESLTKKILQDCRFQVTATTPAAQSAPASEWEATLVIQVL